MNKIRIKSDLTPMNTYVYDENEKLIPVQKMVITIEAGEITKVDLKIPVLSGNGSRIDGCVKYSKMFTFKNWIKKATVLYRLPCMQDYYAKNGKLFRFDCVRIER